MAKASFVSAASANARRLNPLPMNCELKAEKGAGPKELYRGGGSGSGGGGRGSLGLLAAHRRRRCPTQEKAERMSTMSPYRIGILAFGLCLPQGRRAKGGWIRGAWVALRGG